MKEQPWTIILGGLFLSLALVLPLLFHALGLGSAFLPMFYPLVLGGFLLPWSVAGGIGVLAPFLSGVLTGMPPFYPPIAPLMMVEGLILGSGPWLFYQRWHWPRWFSLLVTLLVDRLLLLGLVWVIAEWLSLPRLFISVSSVVRGLPGIVIMMIIIPPLVKEMEKQISLRFATHSGRPRKDEAL
jgi:hypothetical protein